MSDDDEACKNDPIRYADIRAWNDSVKWDTAWFLCDGALQGPAGAIIADDAVFDLPRGPPSVPFKLDPAWWTENMLPDRFKADDKKQRDEHAWEMLVLAAKASRYEP